MNATVKQVTIIGIGLIGGSLALALKKAGFCERVIGTGRTEDTLKKGVELGVIDAYEMDHSRAVAEADIVFIAVPVGAIKAVLTEIVSSVKETAVITDAGSAKRCVVDDAELVMLKRSCFVPGHPIAGTEKSGVTAAFDSLYEGRKVILTPDEETDEAALDLITKMWEATGASVETMSADHHDLVLAGTSHLPHMLAFGLVDCLNNLEDVDEIFRYAAGGFRDFTRIASSDPTMWRDICLNNREAIMTMMNKYTVELDLIYRALENSDGKMLMEVFERAKKTRDQFSQ